MITGPPRHSAALETFLRNFERQGALVGVLAKDAEEHHLLLEELKKAGDAEFEKKFRSVKEKMDEYNRVREFVHEWYIVMQVTFAETYLHDVLVACAAIDPALMADSKQTATYQEVVNATSVDELANQLRSAWARNFIDRGGPSTWIDRLTRMGATGFPADLGQKLEEAWGIRHVVVHSAGRVTQDFARRHATLGFKPGDALKFSKDPVLAYIGNVATFVKATDAFLIARYGSKLETAP